MGTGIQETGGELFCHFLVVVVRGPEDLFFWECPLMKEGLREREEGNSPDSGDIPKTETCSALGW